MKHWLYFLLIILVGCKGNTSTDSLLIATSANMQFAMEEIAESFTEESGIECELIVSSSGKLTAQLVEGAPYDIFVSADMKYPQLLEDRNLVASEPIIYAYGKLVLMTMKDDLTPTLDSLGSYVIRHIAMANPENAPYGRAAMQVLKNLGLDKELKDKLVFGESISQTNQFIMTEAAEFGFTSMSSVKSIAMKENGNWVEIDKELYEPIEQGLVMLNDSEVSREFVRFLTSGKGREILVKYGYSTSSFD